MTSAESKCFSTVLQTSLLLCSPIGNCIFFRFQMSVFIAKVAAVPNAQRSFFSPLSPIFAKQELAQNSWFFLVCLKRNWGRVVAPLSLQERGNCKDNRAPNDFCMPVISPRNTLSSQWGDVSPSAHTVTRAGCVLQSNLRGMETHCQNTGLYVLLI